MIVLQNLSTWLYKQLTKSKLILLPRDHVEKIVIYEKKLEEDDISDSLRIQILNDLKSVIDTPCIGHPSAFLIPGHLIWWQKLLAKLRLKKYSTPLTLYVLVPVGFESY